MEWICWVFAALVIVTLVGHGIWLLLAAMFRSPKAKAQKTPFASRIADMSRTRNHLDELLRDGLIDVQTHQKVIAGLERYRQEKMPPPLPVIPLLAQQVASPRRAVVDFLPERLASTMTVADIGTAASEDFALNDGPSAPAIPLPSTKVAAPLAIPAIPAVRTPPAPRPPRRSLSDVFKDFLHESNIQWGELIGGLLIIGCSIALVTSFWNQIAQKPFFQFAIFTGVTAATLGLGLYTEHRWKLPTTSRGILLIATLLVPLNFLAFATLSHGHATAPLMLLAEVAVLGLFGFLVWRAAQVLTLIWPNLLASGVIALSASLLLAQHLHRAPLFLLAGVPVGILWVHIGIALARARHWKQIHSQGAHAIFLLLGVLGFATALPLGLIVIETGDALRAAQRLSPLLSFATTPALAMGLLLWKRISSKRLATGAPSGPRSASPRRFSWSARSASLGPILRDCCHWR